MNVGIRRDESMASGRACCESDGIFALTVPKGMRQVRGLSRPNNAILPHSGAGSSARRARQVPR